MSLMKYVLGVALAAVLTACGGGGGSAGTTSGSTIAGSGSGGTTTTAPVLPTLTLGLSGGGNSIDASGSTLVQATVKDASGTLVSGKLVTFTGDATLVKFSPASGQVLTVNGVASIQVSPASLSSAGAGTVDAQTTVGTTTLSSSFDYQLAAANLGLQNLNLGTGSLAANGNRAISVEATINGSAATVTPVQVTFNASCGSVSPSIVPTNAAGISSTTYTANVATCAGTNVTITAAAAGAASVQGTIAVDSSIATNVQFISTTPQLIYLTGSVGTTQAQVVFKVVDSSGNSLQNKKLRLALSNTATGVSLGTLGNIDPVDLTSNSSGLVSAAVFSGTVPTSLNVTATLLDSSNIPTAIFSDSNLLTVASGRPTQSSLSLSVGKLSIEGLNRDNESTTVTLSMADRQGNPVPPGTQVNFVTETGVMLPAVCFVPPVIPATLTSPAIPTSSCTVNINSSGTRTKNGRVSILAYTVGEEDFIDVNGNNIYDSGDGFPANLDLGRAFRDDNGQAVGGANATYDSGEFQLPRAGVVACAVGTTCVGDGVWGVADVRKQATLVFASGAATITAGTLTPNTLAVTISDINGNSVPTGSIIEATSAQGNASGNWSGCIISGGNTFTVANTINQTTLNLGFICDPGDTITIKVTTPAPASTITTKTFVILETTAGPTMSTITALSATLTATVNETATGFYLVQLAVATPPTVAAVIAANNPFNMAANVATSASVTGLTTNTNYTLYFVARDTSATPQASPKSVSFTTQ